MSKVEAIKDIIQTSLPEATVLVSDPHNDGEHFEAVVICPSFEGKPLVQQHRLVMGPLKEAFETAVHALALKTYTPEKWEIAQNSDS